MILQRLAEHYDRMAAEGRVVPPGYSRQKISFCIVLNEDGSLNQFESLLEQEGKVKRAKSLDVPGQTKPSGSSINPCLLWDNASYLLGYNPRDEERATRAFEASRAKHLSLEATVSHPAYSAVCAFLRNWKPEHGKKHPELEELTSSFGVFRIAGERQYVHQQIALPSSENGSRDADVAKVTCLVTGDSKIPARLHEPKIKRVAGARPGGVPLVSFNANAFTSYGKEQSYNAPVGEETVFKYANALNQLLDSDRRTSLGDTTAVYWADHHTPVEDVFSDLFSGESPQKEEQKPEEDRKRAEEARLIVSQLRSGTQYTTPKPDHIPTKFFILGLSPNDTSGNAARIFVRLWVEADASEILRRLREHVRDFALDGNDLPPLWRIALAMGRAEYNPKRGWSYDRKSVAPKLAGDLARSVLTGAAYPQSLLAAMVRRISSDGYVSFERVCAIKACLVRNTRHTANPLEIPMKLDQANSDVAYRCGRLFAILEKAQKDSVGGELNSTIKDRYFSAASVTPALAFPRLIQLNGYHLNKLETGSKIYYEKLIGSTMTAPFEFPLRLSLLDQGKFVTGYYQQNQDLYTSRKDKNIQENA